MCAKRARRKLFGQNLISLIHEIDKRVENQMWQETVNCVPLISYLGMVAACQPDSQMKTLR